jgi:uncharacterized protein with NRDE domain
MCTVTYIKYNDQYFFTSNRDENINRQSAYHPQKKVSGNFTYYYPEDPLGKGTWFCVKNNGAICILLNGAHKKHVPNGPYLKSRGIILLDLIENQHIVLAWQELNLEKIEPFTIVSFFEGVLYQFRWDGVQKEQLELNSDEVHIWSSATLYSDEVIAKRKSWFSAFLKANDFKIDGNKMLTFHTETEKDDVENGLQINRNDLIRTKNITQCVLEKNQFTITHMDMLTDEKTIIKDEIVVA